MTEINHKDWADQTKQARDDNGELINVKVNPKIYSKNGQYILFNYSLLVEWNSLAESSNRFICMQQKMEQDQTLS